jgi:xanthosine utilization system XapX-like protein
MYIAKPFRVLSYGLIIGAGVGLTFGLLYRHIGLWTVIPALIAFPVFGLLGGFIVDAFDSWLRRVTRDPIWVRQHEQRKRTP